MPSVTAVSTHPTQPLGLEELEIIINGLRTLDRAVGLTAREYAVLDELEYEAAALRR